MEKELKTSDEWQTLYPEIRVLDADGWDRKNYQFSWFEELISYEEYNKRRMFSTCMGFREKVTKELTDVQKAANEWFELKQFNSAFPADRQSFIEGAKWQEERMFTKEDMLAAARYGYSFHKTTQFPDQDFDDSCVNNTKQWLTIFNKK